MGTACCVRLPPLECGGLPAASRALARPAIHSAGFQPALFCRGQLQVGSFPVYEHSLPAAVRRVPLREDLTARSKCGAST